MSRAALIARRAAGSSLVALTCLGMAACGGADEAATDTAGATAAAIAPAPPGGAAMLNDAQIAHVAVTANAIDSAAGVMAQERGESQAVKDFAQTMVTDHGSVNQQAVALATRLNVTPEDNDVSRDLRAGADQAADSLRALSGAAFDRAYIAREVAYHQAVLDALDGTLIPGAQNAELKQLLQDVRPAIAAHLDRARSIQGSLGGHLQLFTHLAVPVMTRLRQPQRRVLDTLVDAGVARSRSDALAWTVALVGEHADQWLSELRAKMAEVDTLRTEGPQL